MTAFFVLLHLINITFGIKYVNLQPRMVNGIPINANQYPWVVKLYPQIFYKGILIGQGGCTGSLIKVFPPTILTAAHCVNEYEYNSTDGKIRPLTLKEESTFSYSDLEVLFYAFVNRTDNPILQPVVENVNNTFYTLQIKDLSGIYYHSQYNKSLEAYDIALIVLNNQSIDFPENLLPTLPTEQLNIAEPCCNNKEQLIGIGYGANHTDGPAILTLEKIVVNYINSSNCVDRMIQLIANATNITGLPEGFNLTDFLQKQLSFDELLICVIGNNQDVCHGDSGGPLFKTVNNRPYIIGVASFIVNECNDGNPSVYTSVSHYVDWIHKTMAFAIDGITIEPTTNPTIAPTTVNFTYSPTDITETPSVSPTATPTASPVAAPITAKPKEDNMWFKLAIAFIVLFGIALLMIGGFFYKACNESGKINDTKKGKYQQAKSTEIEAGTVQTAIFEDSDAVDV